MIFGPGCDRSHISGPDEPGPATADKETRLRAPINAARRPRLAAVCAP